MKHKNWRTTLAGGLAAAATVALSLAQSGTVDGRTIGCAAGLAFIGYLAKDAGVSGTEK